jgi:hypothetical protein
MPTTTTAQLSETEQRITVRLLGEDTDFDTAPDGQLMPGDIEYVPRQWDEWEPDVYDAALLGAGWRRVSEWSGPGGECQVEWAGR